jgi:hypothetical protein
MKLRIAALAMSVVLAACAPDENGADAAAEVPATAATTSAPAEAQLACSPQRDTQNRQSPYDSTHVMIGARHALVCYGRPSARGRTMIGGESVPYGRLWRTGANEPTIIHVDFPAEIAGIAVEPGAYSLYSVPAEDEWTIIVNRAIDQWGHESAYTPEVEGQEVGRASVPASQTAQHVEQFTITSEPAGEDQATLVLEWENTRVEIPIRAR